MAAKFVVFLDYQNVYMGAREAFNSFGSPSSSPALEFVRDLKGSPYPRCEVAAWSSSDGHSRRLSIPRGKIWCHWLDESDYRLAADPTNYADSACD